MKITSILTQSIGGAGIAGSRLINSYIELIDGVYTRDISNINAKNKLISHNKFSYFDRFNQRLLQPKVLVPKKGVIKSTFQTRYYFGKINSDVINLHWVANYLDWHTFFRDNSNKKIVWTLHDMNPFMGVYHYDGDMQYDDFRYNEIEDTALKYKLKIIRKFKPNLHICSPSKWLLEKSKNSKLFSQFPHYHIPYGIPLDIYKPINKNIALVHFGLEDKPTIMFSSISLATKRKGFHLLKKIIPDIINMGIQIVVAGKSSQKIDNVKYLGAINNENLMAMAYNTCDAYVLPSLQDNLPNTMLESLACAKPVITFNHFGMGEVVKEGLNGFLSNEITADGLLKSITRWVNFYKSKNNTDDFYSRIRLEVEQQFNQEKQLKMYLKVFEQV